jgi:hypothetical protein
LLQKPTPPRWLITTNSFAEASKVYMSLKLSAEALGDDSGYELGRQFEELAKDPRRAASTVLLTSPYIAYQGQCLSVQQFYLYMRPPRRGCMIDEGCCLALAASSEQQAVSLDSAFLYAKIEPSSHAIDHRVCCQTWDRNVMQIARHRTDITNQSFIMARDALPLGSSTTNASALRTTVVYFAGNYRLEDVYRTFSYAAAAAFQAFRVFGFDADALQGALTQRYPPQHSMLRDLLTPTEE